MFLFTSFWNTVVHSSNLLKLKRVTPENVDAIARPSLQPASVRLAYDGVPKLYGLHMCDPEDRGVKLNFGLLLAVYGLLRESVDITITPVWTSLCRTKAAGTGFSFLEGLPGYPLKAVGPTCTTGSCSPCDPVEQCWFMYDTNRFTIASSHALCNALLQTGSLMLPETGIGWWSGEQRRRIKPRYTQSKCMGHG